MFRGFTGLGLALVIGVVVGVAMARNRWIDAALEPMLSGLYAIPKISLYPVMIAALGLGGAAKIWQVALECAFPIAFNAYAGAKSVDANHLALARNVGASPLRVVKDIIAPSAFLGSSPGFVSQRDHADRDHRHRADRREPRARLRHRKRASKLPTGEAMAVVVVLGVLGFSLDRLNVLLGRRLVSGEKGVQL